jgi:hypothetical protein
MTLVICAFVPLAIEAVGNGAEANGIFEIGNEERAA